MLLIAFGWFVFDKEVYESSEECLDPTQSFMEQLEIFHLPTYLVPIAVLLSHHFKACCARSNLFDRLHFT